MKSCGYGGTDAPEDVDDYTQFHLVGDMVGLVAALGEERAVIVGHDWGAPVAWNAAMWRPDVFRAVAALSVPALSRGPPPVQARWLCGRGIRMARAAGRAMRACERLGFEVAPVLIADAQPSDTIRSETY